MEKVVSLKQVKENKENNIRIFNHREFGEVRTLLKDNEPWFVGKDIAEALGYKNVSDALGRHVDIEDKDEMPIPDSIGRKQNTPIINKDGVAALVAKSNLLTQSEKQKFLEVFGLDDRVVLHSRPEIEFGEQLTLFVGQLGYKVELQHKVLSYYIDFYIPELNIAIEYDEDRHKYSYEEDKQRELEIQKEIGCKFVRVNDGLNVGTQLGLVAKFIMEDM